MNPSSGVPIYLQIEAQIKNAIATGSLTRGNALPPVRKAAANLGINPNTVARAYQNLERDGVLITAAGAGTRVAENGTGLLKSEKLRRIRPYARQIAVEGMQLRLSDDEIIKVVQEELDTLGGERNE